jgi:tetratricopeptide (TPR) repeat protein
MKLVLILFLSLVFVSAYSQENETLKNPSSIAVTIIDAEQREMFQKMAEELTQQIANDKSNLTLIKKRAPLYLVLKEHDKAIADYNLLIQMDASNASHYYFRGLNKLGINDAVEACIDFKKATQLGHKDTMNELMLLCQ